MLSAIRYIEFLLAREVPADAGMLTRIDHG
jgi:hypothetical protein